ncbi:hypothetical protein H4Q26_009145 [Puccinia striiformis f. sp. tritici PST-130]|nr:hypothetical protein H4Q26_009145 [Puccinia striiformis f. sp. tritici PST-130]
MANSHQDPGITRGGPPGPALNPTITQKETALRELMELVIEADKIKGVNTLDEFSRFRVFFEDITYPLDSREGGSDSDGLTKIFWHCLHQELQGSIAESLIFDGHMILDENFHLAELPHYSILVEYIYRSYISLDYPDEMPTEVPFISEKQLPNQSASLDILGMEEIGENGGQNISEEYGLTLESDWSLQPDLFEESKGLNPSSTSSQSTKASAIPAKSPRNESNNQPPSFEIPTKAPVMLENQQSNGSVPLDTPGIEENINPETPPQLSDCPSQEEWNFQCHLSEKFTEEPSAITQHLDIKELEFGVEEQSCWSSPPILSSPPPSLPPPTLSETEEELPHNQPENREINQPDIQPTAPTPIANSGKEPCSDGAGKTVDQFLKSSNSCRVSTINNISIKSETEDFSALINNPEDRTYLGRTLAKEYLGIKEEFYQVYHQFSPPPKYPTLNISGQNKQALEDSVTKIIPVNIPYDTGSRKFLVNNQDISLCSSHFLVGLMRPSAKLGEEDWAKALEFKIYYHYFFYQQPEDIFFITKAKNKTEGDHLQESVIIQTMVYLGKSVLDYYELTKKPPFHSSLLRNLGDDVRRLEVNNRRFQMVSDGERWDQEYTITATERDTEDGRGEASDEEETEIGREGGMATIENGGNCPSTPLLSFKNDPRPEAHPLRRGGTLCFISEDGRFSLEQQN